MSTLKIYKKLDQEHNQIILIPKINICNITKINIIKNDFLKLGEKESLLKIKKQKKEYITKNLKNKGRNMNESFSTGENTTLKSKISNKCTTFDEQKEVNLNQKDINIKQKYYMNQLKEFILILTQKICKNVNQFVFYIFKFGKRFKCDKNIFFCLIKRIINIYNILIQNKNNDNIYFDLIEFIHTNLSKNIEDYKKFNYISYIPENSENNLKYTEQFFDDLYLYDILFIIIRIEHDDCPVKDLKEDIIKLFQNYNLKNRNIFAILRYADTLYKQIIKNKNKSNNYTIRLGNIKSFYIKPKFINNIVCNNNKSTNYLSFSYFQHPNIHIKHYSFENIENMKNILFSNKLNNNILHGKNKINIYFSITKINKFKNSYRSSGEIDVFKNVNENEENKEIINKIYDDYYFDKINKINIFESENGDEEEMIHTEKIRRISRLSNESESEIINEINCYEEDFVLNQIKQCFDEIDK